MAFLTGQNAGSGLFHVWMNTTGRSDSSALVQALARLPFRRRRWSPTPVPAHALELRTHVGQTHSRWRSTPRRSPTFVPISNARTQLSRLWAGADAGARRTRPGADVGPTPAPAHALELCTHVGQTHSRWRSTPRRSPTHVPNSNARTQLSRLWAGDARIHTREAQTTEVSRSPTLHASERGRQVIEDC